MAVKKDPRTLELAEPFVSLFPVQPEVLDLVKDSIREHGFQLDKPILVWKDAFGDSGRQVVIDGHTRLRAALDLKLNEVFTTVRQFKNTDAAITAGIGEQVIRRNLNREQIAAYVVSILPLLDETKGGLRARTAKELAAMLGVSIPTIDRARGVIGSGDEELIAKVKDGDLSLLAAYDLVTGRVAPPKTYVAPPAMSADEIRANVEEIRAAAEEERRQAQAFVPPPNPKITPESAAHLDEARKWILQAEEAEDLYVEENLEATALVVEAADELAAENPTGTPEKRLAEIHELLELIDRLTEQLQRITADVTVNATEHRGAFRIAQLQFHLSGAIYALNRAKTKTIDLRDITKVVKLPAEAKQVASVSIRTRTTSSGEKRYLVEYRVGGRDTKTQHGGSFRTRRLATVRAGWIEGELAASRIPAMQLLEATPPTVPTFAEQADLWRSSRVDVTEGTRTLHRVALQRATPSLGTVPLDELTVQHFVDLVTALDAGGSKRETIRKTIKYSAAVLEDAGIDPNPARDKRVRLPHEEQDELVPPTAEHVEAVYRTLASDYRLPLLWLDWSGARVASVESVLVGDYDEPQRRIRLRGSTTKTRAALWVEVPDQLADALEQRLPPREDRDPDAPLFPGVTAARLRTAIGRACRANGIPVFSPHDLRHRRISVLHRQGRSWAEIGRFVGQRKLSITADTYTHVLVDSREVDYAGLLR